MWLVRLLPGMGPPTETPKTAGSGKNKIRIKPSMTLPPANVNAKTIVAAHREAIEAFHRACGGRVDQIHGLFCQIAEHNGKPPMPSQVMAAMLDLTPEDLKDGPCVVSEVQLTAAFERMVKPQDNGDNFKEKVMVVVEQQTKRSQHAANEMVKLQPVLARLHGACDGASKALFTFFMDLLPEDQSGQYTIEMWNVMVMKCPPTTAKIPLEHFIDCFRESMDSTDTADAIIVRPLLASAAAVTDTVIADMDSTDTADAIIVRPCANNLFDEALNSENHEETKLVYYPGS